MERRHLPQRPVRTACFHYGFCRQVRHLPVSRLMVVSSTFNVSASLRLLTGFSLLSALLNSATSSFRSAAAAFIDLSN